MATKFVVEIILNFEKIYFKDRKSERKAFFVKRCYFILRSYTNVPNLLYNRKLTMAAITI